MYKNSFKIGILALAPMPASAEILPLDTLVVTGAANPLSGIRSSVALSTLDRERMQQSAPSSAAKFVQFQELSGTGFATPFLTFRPLWRVFHSASVSVGVNTPAAVDMQDAASFDKARDRRGTEGERG